MEVGTFMEVWTFMEVGTFVECMCGHLWKWGHLQLSLLGKKILIK